MDHRNIELTDKRTGLLLTINVDNIDDIKDMGHYSILVFPLGTIYVRETYDEIQNLLSNL